MTESLGDTPNRPHSAEPSGPPPHPDLTKSAAAPAFSQPVPDAHQQPQPQHAPAPGYPTAPPGPPQGFQQDYPHQGYPQQPQFQQGQLPPGQAQYGHPGYPAAGAMRPEDERLWGIISHVGGPAVALVSGGILHWVPALVGYLMFKDKSAFVRQHASEALNFQVTLLIGYAVCWVITIVTFGLAAPLLAVPWLFSIVFAVLAAVAASRNEPYRYPINIRIFS